MSDWQKGDLALCVNTRKSHRATAGVRFKKGRIYTVAGVSLTSVPEGYTNGPYLFIHEDASGLTAAHWRFRKVTPPKADEFDREVIDLMAGKKVTA